MENKKSILFLCTHNSARSQIAEGLVNHFFQDTWIAFSAGTEISKINPYTLKIMNEYNIDISNQYSKHLNDFLSEDIDYVVTVCDDANDKCPNFPNAKNRMHLSLPDPSIYNDDEELAMIKFKEIYEKILNWLNFKLPTM